MVVVLDLLVFFTHQILILSNFRLSRWPIIGTFILKLSIFVQASTISCLVSFLIYKHGLKFSLILVTIILYCSIVYYAPREEKIWTVHISCKLPPKPKARVANTRCGLANFTPVERIHFFVIVSIKYLLCACTAGRTVGTLRIL